VKNNSIANPDLQTTLLTKQHQSNNLIPLHCFKDLNEAKYQIKNRNFDALTPVDQPDPPEMQLGPEKIPKYLKYSSKIKDNDIEQVR